MKVIVEATITPAIYKVRWFFGSATTSSEDVEKLLARKASLQLRIAAGERELAALEQEIALAESVEHSDIIRKDRLRREEREQRNRVVAQVMSIDDQLSGRKPITVEKGPAGQDFVSNMANARHHLEQLRERVMREAGLTEADVSLPPATTLTQLRPDGSGWT
jgi:hypothetical protein